MMFFKLWIHDLHNGIGRRIWQYLLLAAPMSLLFCFEFYRMVEGWQLIREDIVTDGTWGTYILFLFQGMDEYIPSPETPFVFPAMWLLLFLGSSYLTLSYPLNDLTGIGQQVLMRSGGRKNWWLSKCFWNFLSTFLYFGLIILTVTLFCVALGIPLSNSLDVEISRMLLESYDIPSLAGGTFFLWIILFPLLVSLLLNLIQMTVGLALSMVWGFAASAVTLLVSAYWMKPWMVGNFAMFRRSKLFLQYGGMDATAGIILIAIGVGATLIIGTWYFERYDILNRE